MRNQIYTDKRAPTPAPVPEDPAEDMARIGRKKKARPFYFEPETLDYSHIWTPIPTQPNEIIPAGNWSERQTEEAILHIIRTLNNTRHNSNGKVFERVFQRFLAQLGDIEYADELRIPDRGMRTVQNGYETQVNTQTIAANDNEDTEMDLDESSSDELQADHYLQPKSRLRKRTVLAPRTKEKPASPMTVRFQAVNIPPSGSLLSYLPAVYPATMAAYITPFSSSSAPIPYSWVDAPCLPSSYAHFVAGVRLRAGVPKPPRGRNLVIVLAYGWNDFCRLLRNEQDWAEGFQKDIRRAAETDRVDVWRIRVCCFN